MPVYEGTFLFKSGINLNSLHAVLSSLHPLPRQYLRSCMLVLPSAHTTGMTSISEYLTGFGGVFYHCRTKQISGSPRHKSLKKMHFIKNMRQY